MNATTPSILFPALTALPSTRLVVALVCTTLAVLTQPARADTFGSGANTFTIEFVDIGNPGNGVDPSTGYGAVPYTYRIGAMEVPQDAITKATANGLANVTAGAWSGMQPAANITWYEMAAFVNWLNTSTGHQKAYDLVWTGSVWTMNLWSAADSWDNDPGAGEDLNRYRHRDTLYFLPSENEWYKAAYHKNDGATPNYWLYATGSDTVPTAVASGTGSGTAVYSGVSSSPANVNNNGGLSPYWTRGQNGNVDETVESAFFAPNDSSSEGRTFRGGWWPDAETSLRSSFRGNTPPTNFGHSGGFRIASVPDKDGDGILDQFETGTGIYVSPTDTGTSPTNPDTDGDGLFDGEEVNTYYSNPNVRDTDGDGFDDGFEVSTGFDPTSATSTPDALSSIRAAAEYRFNAAAGVSYRIETSTDLANWTTIEFNIIGSGGVITRLYSIEGQPRRFFRSRRN